MTQEPNGRAHGRTTVLVVGLLAASVAVIGAFAVDGPSPSRAGESVSSAEAVVESTAEASAPVASVPPTPPTPPPATLPASEQAEPGAVESLRDQQASEAPAVSGAIGVPPPKPQPNDAVLGETPQEEDPAVDLNDTVEVVEGVTVGVSDLIAVQGIADEPGEVAGDAVRVPVTLTNSGAKPVDTSTVVVSLEAGPDAVPGMALRGAGTTTFPPSIEPGTSATAEYVFVIDPNQRDDISVLVNYSVTAPVAVFDGIAPPAKEDR